MIGLRVSYLPGFGPHEIRRFLLRAAGASQAVSEVMVRKATKKAYLKVVSLAPRETGVYADSIGMNVESTSQGARGEVGTNHPAARRLEFGFVGADSRGRNYRQRPRPHFGPAVPAAAAFVDGQFRKSK